MKKLVITGGTGSLGRRLARTFRHSWKVVVFSRDEFKHFEMADAMPDVEFVLGDVRDERRVMEALEGANAVVHAAALKQAPPGEWQPDEYIQTNIVGTQNVVRAAVKLKIPVLISISTCKAVAPLNLYGATKLCADKIVVAAGLKAFGKQRLAVVRFGNFWGSRGSVVPYFLSHPDPLPITDPEMTRFSVTGDEAANMIRYALETAVGGEIFIPRSPTYRVGDLAEALGRPYKKVGMRPGEKLHEEILHSADAPFTLAYPHHFIRVPQNLDEYRKIHGGEAVEAGFQYVSSSKETRLSVQALKDLMDVYRKNLAQYGDGF
jgi:FlaA1/EpsC-like NDP-sugar epimerase